MCRPVFNHQSDDTAFWYYKRHLPLCFGLFRIFCIITSIVSCFCRMASSAATQAVHKPKVLVFDLDYTLWPFWVDTHVDPPFKMANDGKVYDTHRRPVSYYSDVPEVLKHLHSEGYKLGIASRTSCPAEANDLTRLFKWDQFFTYREIYPGSKTTHFQKIHKNSGVAYEDMIFFDDEHRNIVEVGKMGVLCIFVDNGVTRTVVDDALKKFAERKHKASKHANGLDF